MNQDPEFMNFVFQYGVMTISLVVAGTLCFYLFFNPNVAKSNTIFYSFLMMAFVMAGFFVCSLFFGNQSEFSNLPALITATMAVFFILAVVYFWNIHIVQSFISSNIVGWILGISIVLFGLAFIYSIAKKTIRGLQNEYSWSGFIAQFIFFIPCMIYDFFVYLADQFNATPNIVFILFVIELVLITLFVSSPYLLNYFLNVKSTFLLPDAVFLSNKNLLSDSNPMLLDNVGQDNIRNNFSISMWVYINDYDRTPDRQPQTIFHYGEEGSPVGHPHIDYQDQQLVFTFSNRDFIPEAEGDNDKNGSQYRMNIEPQKWVFLVLNYKNNEMDLFVNAELKKNIRFTDNVPQYGLTEIVNVGDKQGIDGAICNVIYYPFPQTLADITAQYNLLMFSNPPVYSTFLMNKKGGIPRPMD